ncbi:acyltransferase [Cytobacillus suaedae]|nr:acyltransferase [Cytobacillus suaedae]
MTNNNAVDVMKFICAILVVIIHVPPLFSYNETANFILVDIISRMAVPFFFVCAGYFLFNKIDFKNEKIEKSTNNSNLFKRYIKHLIIIYIFWTLFYLLWWIPSWYYGGYLTLANIKGYVLSIFLNGSYYHLWYIVSLIYGLLFTFLLLRFVRIKIVIITAVIFYLIGTFAYSYTWLVSGNSFIEEVIKVYNSLGSVSVALFRAFPYLLIGLIFSKYRMRISSPLSALLSVICFLLIGLEVWLLNFFGVSSRFSNVFFTGVTVFLIFSTAINIKLKDNMLYPFLRKMSSIIYFIHPMFININGLFLLHYFSSKNSLILFSTVLVFVMFFSVGLIKLSQTPNLNKLKSLY